MVKDIDDKRDFRKNIEFKMVDEINEVMKKKLDAFRIYGAIKFSDYIPQDFYSTFFKVKDEDENREIEEWPSKEFIRQ